jgi:hypothetical protein
MSKTNTIIIREYGDKALIAYGNTKPYKDAFGSQGEGGKWVSNVKSLSTEDEKVGAWVFSRKKYSTADVLCEKIADRIEGDVTFSVIGRLEKSPKVGKAKVGHESSKPVNSNVQLNVSLEKAIVELTKTLKEGLKCWKEMLAVERQLLKMTSARNQEDHDDVDSDVDSDVGSEVESDPVSEEDEDQAPPKRLLRRKKVNTKKRA